MHGVARTGASDRPGLLVSILLLVGFVAACSTAPAGELERSVDQPTTTRVVAAPPPTSGELRAEVPGIGPAAGADVDPALADPPEHVVLVGDSVLVQVVDDLARQVHATLHVDAADCRRIDRDVTGACGGVPAGSTVADGIEAMASVLADLTADGIRPEAAVIVLANNSSLQAGQLDTAMRVLADIPRVWWVTTRIEGFGRQDPNNALLADLADRDPRAGVIDWYEHSAGEDWFGDHVHPTLEGEVALARLIARHLRCDCTP